MWSLPFRSAKAPEIRDGLEWIGASQPVRVESLRGRVVMLDFWTYG